MSKQHSRLLGGARRRAKKQGVAFNLTQKDIHIPDLCPALGITICPNFGGAAQHDTSPTLDRIIPGKGYTPGNVVVISAKANAIKSSATLDELELVCGYVRRLQESHK